MRRCQAGDILEMTAHASTTALGNFARAPCLPHARASQSVSPMPQALGRTTLSLPAPAQGSYKMTKVM